MRGSLKSSYNGHHLSDFTCLTLELALKQKKAAFSGRCTLLQLRRELGVLCKTSEITEQLSALESGADASGSPFLAHTHMRKLH